MENNRHSAKVRLWLSNIPWIHIDTKFEDFLSSAAVISKTNFAQRGCYTKSINHLGQKHYQDTWIIGTKYTKRCKFFWQLLKMTFFVNFCLCKPKWPSFSCDLGRTWHTSSNITGFILSTHTAHTFMMDEPFLSNGTFSIYQAFVQFSIILPRPQHTPKVKTV